MRKKPDRKAVMLEVIQRIQHFEQRQDELSMALVSLGQALLRAQKPVPDFVENSQPKEKEYGQ